MPAVFESLDYRSLCSSLAGELKAKTPHWTLQRIAEKIPVHGPYLSNVFRKKAHFSADQLFELTKILKLDPGEAEYVLLLQDWERCASPSRREELKKKIDRERKRAKRTEEHLQAEVRTTAGDAEARYFLNPDLFLVSTFLGIDRFAREPALIAKALQLPEKQIKEMIDELVRMEYFARGKKGEIFPGAKAKSFHLSKTSPLCDPHVALLHLRAQQHQRSLAADENYAFSVTFTGTQESREALHAEFLKFLKRAEQIVKDAPSEDVFQMTFNLFPWSR